MSTLELYNSQGERLGDESAPSNGRIEDFFFDGVRLYLDMRTDPELIMFFRARETESGRAEQYYAVYNTETSTRLFERFARDLRQAVEDDHNLILEPEGDDSRLVSLLTTDPGPPGTDGQQSTISSLLADGTALQLGVDTDEAAFGLLKTYVSSPADEFAIGDDVSANSVSTCNLVIEPGTDSELTPLGDSTEVFDDRLRQATANAQRTRADNVDEVASTDTDRIAGVGREIVAVGVGIVVALVIFILLLNGAAAMGIRFPSIEWLVFV